MRKVFIEVKTRHEAKKHCPWAARITKVVGGFMVFESTADFKTLQDSSIKKKKPLVVYHGTDAVFDEFNPDFINELTGHGAYWFSVGKSYAGQYTKTGRITKHNLKVENIFDTINNPAHKKLYDKWILERKENGLQIISEGTAPEGYASDYSGHALPGSYHTEESWNNYKKVGKNTPTKDRAFPYWENADWLVEKVKKNGFDGSITSDGMGEIGIGVFDPKKIINLEKSLQSRRTKK